MDVRILKGRFTGQVKVYTYNLKERVSHMETNLEKIMGCLYGGAVGDALGYPIEFRRAEEIFAIYGEKGISSYELFHGKALISDDTQMTLFTANGLLVGYTRLCLRGIMGPWQSYIESAYKDWLKTQNDSYCSEIPYCSSWLLNCKELYSNRAPGNTCLSALCSKECGSIDNRINNSKGCGGIMRIAPIGLYLPRHINSIRKIDVIGAEAAAITHGHPLGFIPAAALTHIIARCVISEDSLELIVKEAIQTAAELFRYEKHIEEFTAIMDRAIRFANEEMEDMTAIRELGEGWVAEETLAIAVYCALKYQKDFEKGVVASVNHDGDSDSTGAVTGNILGAYLGIDSIPNKFIEPLELKDVIGELAVDMYEDCKMSEYGNYRDEKWMQKYVTGQYDGRRQENTNGNE